MNLKALIIGALLCGFAIFPARAADPITYKEIAMLLRNGEQAQSIMDETTQRKLLQPLAPLEKEDLISLGATPALIKMLESPATLATPESATAYSARLQQQQAMLEQQRREDERGIARAASTPVRQQAQAPQPANSPANEFAGKPLDLQFTSADGAPVNLADLRGKVVLIDFWATWCKPCMKKVPEVVDVYKKYHDQGFEIIGISLDKSDFTMRNVTREKGMTWPQYFDGLAWQNKISSRFHIREIPTMWLVNKAGIVADAQAGDNLDAEIAKFLAE